MSDQDQNFDDAWDAATADPTEAKQEEELVQPSESAEEPAEAEPAPEPAAEETNWEDLYNREVQKTKSWEGRIRKANQSASEAQEEVARLRQEIQQLRGAPKAEASAAETSLDDATLEQFVKEFPEIHTPLLALVRKEARALVEKEMGDIKPTVQQIKQSADERAASDAEQAALNHFEAIRSKHSDFQELVDNGTLEQWIETKPAIFQKALTDVRDKGTATEVIEMFDHLKRDLGLSPTSKQEGDKRDKLKSLVAVRGSAPVIPAKKPAASDYDAAWDEANRTQ